MVPGAFGTTGLSGHSPHPLALLSQSPFVGIGTKIPDFIWLASDSANFTPVFIEIESHCKRWFRADKAPTHSLVQAVSQLAERRAWLNYPGNVGVFYSSFEIPDDMRRDHHFRPELLLIYGRRREFEEHPELRRLRAQFEPPGKSAMTFDRLRPARECRYFLTVTKRNAGYQALAVPATFEIGPNVARSFTGVSNLTEAIQQNDWI
jgi:Domain of unknown function (DUF4263)